MTDGDRIVDVDTGTVPPSSRTIPGEHNGDS